MRTLVAHFLVPLPQILIGNLSVYIEYKNACVSTEVVRWVQLIKGFLPGCVPDV